MERWIARQSNCMKVLGRRRLRRRGGGWSEAIGKRHSRPGRQAGRKGSRQATLRAKQSKAQANLRLIATSSRSFPYRARTCNFHQPLLPFTLCTFPFSPDPALSLPLASTSTLLLRPPSWRIPGRIVSRAVPLSRQTSVKYRPSTSTFIATAQTPALLIAPDC